VQITRAARWAALAGVLVAVGTVGGSVRAAVVPTTWGATDVHLNLPVDGDIGRYETAIAIDPVHPDVIVAGVIDLNWATDHPGQYSNIREYRSTDAGASWADLGYLPFVDAGDPQFAFDGLGNLLSASVGATGTAVTRSTDGGVTWSPAVTIDPDNSATASLDPNCGFGDKEELAIDPRNGDAYVFWSHSQLGCFVPDAGGDTTVVYFSRSTDHGVTWSAPARVSEPASNFSLGAAPAIGPDGTLYVVYEDQRPITSPTDCPAAYAVVVEAYQHNPDAALTEDTVIATSHDGGATWSYRRRNHCETSAWRIVKRYTKNGTYVDGFMPSIDVDQSTGAVYIAWGQTSLDGVFSTELTRSTDGGASWTTTSPITVPAGVDVEFPSVTAFGGRVWLQDLESQSDGSFDYFVRESTDGGLSFSAPVRLTSQTSHGAPQGGTDIGDYQWIDSVQGRVASIWSDHRTDGAVDVYVRTGTFS
jgi:hypothetical protein